jgi:predicted O-methyltransferase YrrM
MKKTISSILPISVKNGIKKILKRISPSLVTLISDEEKVRKNRELAVHWCGIHSITTSEAIRFITGLTFYRSFYDVNANTYKEAEKRAKDCPVSMGGPGDLELIFQLAEHIKANSVIETGVAYGWSSLAFLLSLKKRDGSWLVSTDMPYPRKNNENYVGVVVPENLRSGWHLLRGPDSAMLPRAVKMLDEIDMCHYDSDKSYEGRMWAYPILWNALRSGGIFLSDDVSDNLAFKDFSNSVSRDPIVVEKNIPHIPGKYYVGILIKP